RVDAKHRAEKREVEDGEPTRILNEQIVVRSCVPEGAAGQRKKTMLAEPCSGNDVGERVVIAQRERVEAVPAREQRDKTREVITTTSPMGGRRTRAPPPIRSLPRAAAATSRMAAARIAAGHDRRTPVPREPKAIKTRAVWTIPIQGANQGCVPSEPIREEEGRQPPTEQIRREQARKPVDNVVDHGRRSSRWGPNPPAVLPVTCPTRTAAPTSRTGMP